ncbi:hypothetical protein [Latilactobacillus sakei]|uniref:hypothetical protein n=1 Tax=Latilactobacillus sakei TaxID=1599 RepID=UPI002FC388D8
MPERYLTTAKETPKAQTDAAKTIRVAFADGATTVWSSPTYTQPTGRYMTYGQTEGIVKTQTVSGEEWYQLANGGWIPARFTGEGQLKSTPVVKQAATPTQTTPTQAPVQSTTAAKVVTPAAETVTSERTSVATPPVASSSVSVLLQVHLSQNQQQLLLHQKAKLNLFQRQRPHHLSLKVVV